MSYEQDAWTKAYLESVRQRNKDRLSKCFICKKQSTTITAILHKVLPVCDIHNIDRN
jgi:hypothetical protein